MGSVNYGLAPGAVPGDLGPVPAAAHAAPFPLARPRGVLEHPPALRVLTDAQPRRIALDQLTRDRLGKPRDGAINRVALVAMDEGDDIGRADQLVDVVRTQGPDELIHNGRYQRL